MEELIQQVCQKTGLSPEKAKSAVETVLTFVKGKLPAALAGQVDAAVGKGASGLNEAIKGMGGLFGKQ